GGWRGDGTRPLASPADRARGGVRGAPPRFAGSRGRFQSRGGREERGSCACARALAGSPGQVDDVPANLNVLTAGGAHTHEAALAAAIDERKRRDPFARIAVVVPSRSIRLHLLAALPGGIGRALLGVHLLTLDAFAREILAGEGEPA